MGQRSTRIRRVRNLIESVTKVNGTTKNQLVRCLGEDLVSPVADLRSKVADDLTAGEAHTVSRPVAASLRSLSPDWRGWVERCALDDFRLSLWRRFRNVYDVSPDIWSRLTHIRDDSQVLTELIRRLPNPNPLIIFPERIRFDGYWGDDGEPQYAEIFGMFVQGIRLINGEDYIGCSTHHPQVDGVSLIFVGNVFDAESHDPVCIFDGVTQDALWINSSIPFDRTPQTMSDLVSKQLARFGSRGRVNYLDIEFMDSAKIDQHLPTLLKCAVGALMYVCARNADIVSPEQRQTGKKVKAKKARNARREPTVHDVGYRVGAAITATQRKYTERQGAPDTKSDDRKRPRAHMVSPHLRHYWVGPGRRELIAHWIDWYEVNTGTEPAETVIRPVR